MSPVAPEEIFVGEHEYREEEYESKSKYNQNYF
jgi:hypothetical protein